MSQTTPNTSTPQPAWTDPLLANPHTVSDKATRVNQMFSAIAPSYDLNNRLHSLWMDQHWRSVAVRMAEVKAGDRIVDVACGTGDLTIKFASALNEMGARGANHVMGIDFTYAMLPIAREKAGTYVVKFNPEEWQKRNAEDIAQRRVTDARPADFSSVVEFLQGDAMALPLPDASVDVLSIAFGIRNVSDWGKAIEEFARVLRPGGRLVILEFSLPRNPVLLAFYNFYFRKIMPITATLISGDKSGAYKYLPQSVNTFISREAMQTRMNQAGFTEVVARPLTFGICVCYRGTLPKGAT